MRKVRPKHKELSEAARKRANARAYVNTYLRRGLIAPQPCKVCGEEKSEKHHEDYDKPLEITWLCRTCHLAHHTGVKRNFTLE